MFKSLFRKISYAALTCSAICGLSSTGFAATDTGLITVSGVVGSTCTSVSIPSSAVNFGSIVAGVNTVTATLSANCTPGSTYWLGLNGTSGGATSLDISTGLAGENEVLSVSVAANPTSGRSLTFGSNSAYVTATTGSMDTGLDFSTTPGGSQVAGEYTGTTTIYINFI